MLSVSLTFSTHRKNILVDEKIDAIFSNFFFSGKESLNLEYYIYPKFFEKK